MKPLLFTVSAVFLALASFSVSAQTAAPEAYAAATKQMEMRLSAVETQMRALTGQVEQFSYSLSTLQKSVERLQADTDARLRALEEAPKPKAEAPKAEAPKESLPQITSSPKPTSDDKLSIDEQYDRAFAFLRQTDYNEAERAFKSFLQKHPKNKLTENAKYWYAETFYVRGRFGDAAIAFADAYEHNPKGSKAPDSLLKLAMSLAAIDKVDDACNTLSALDSKYPKAPMTIRTRSKQERARLKCK